MNASANIPAGPDIGGVGGRTTAIGGDISGVGDTDCGGGGVDGLATVGGGEGDVSGLLPLLLLLLLLEIDAGFTTGEIGDGTWPLLLLGAPPPVAPAPPARALGKENTPTDAISSCVIPQHTIALLLLFFCTKY